MDQSERAVAARALDFYVRFHLKPLQDKGEATTPTGQVVSEEIGEAHALFGKITGADWARTG